MAIMSSGGRHSIGRIVVIMIMVVIIGIVVARTYYRSTNRSVDPRIVRARELYSGYDNYARLGDYHAIFALLDSVELIYNDTKHYKGSFELGVVENNRAAALLTIALYRDSIPGAADPFPELTSDSIISLAEIHVKQAIETYDRWNSTFEEKTNLQIRMVIKSDFLSGLNTSDPDMKEKYLETRVKEIERALEEYNRRVSVCFTNLGLIYRYRGEFEAAVRQYETAIRLWDRNLDAENNLNKLLNRPVKKRNLLQKLFPPERENNE